LRHDKVVPVTIPDRYPQLSLPYGSGILSPSGSLTLELSATNVEAVVVVASEVLPGNLVPHLRGERARYTSRQVLSRRFELASTPNLVPQPRPRPRRAVLGVAERRARGVLDRVAVSEGLLDP
jgi:hypothetical protein